MFSFTSSKGVISGDIVKQALISVADDMVKLAYAIKEENAYATHVTEAEKEANLVKQLKLADDVRQGKVTNFAVWQRINEKLTGECVAFFNEHFNKEE